MTRVDVSFFAVARRATATSNNARRALLTERKMCPFGESILIWTIYDAEMWNKSEFLTGKLGTQGVANCLKERRSITGRGSLGH
jgi:hypothetical protein